MQPAEFESVMTAARANADWAWEQLYLHYAPDVLQFLRVQKAPYAEDVLGEVFVDVVRSLHSFTGDASEFRSWLFRLAVNRLIDQHRRDQRRAEDLVEQTPEHAVPSAEEAVLIHADEDRFYRLIGVLPEDQRAAVFLRYGLDMSIADVASVVERSEGAVKMLLQRGMQTLRERLSSDFGN